MKGHGIQGEHQFMRLQQAGLCEGKQHDVIRKESRHMQTESK